MRQVSVAGVRLFLLLIRADSLQFPLQSHDAFDRLEGFSRRCRLAEIQFVELVPLMMEFHFVAGSFQVHVVLEFGRVFQH